MNKLVCSSSKYTYINIYFVHILNFLSATKNCWHMPGCSGELGKPVSVSKMPSWSLNSSAGLELQSWARILSRWTTGGHLTSLTLSWSIYPTPFMSHYRNSGTHFLHSFSSTAIDKTVENHCFNAHYPCTIHTVTKLLLLNNNNYANALHSVINMAFVSTSVHCPFFFLIVATISHHLPCFLSHRPPPHSHTCSLINTQITANNMQCSYNVYDIHNHM